MISSLLTHSIWVPYGQYRPGITQEPSGATRTSSRSKKQTKWFWEVIPTNLLKKWSRMWYIAKIRPESLSFKFDVNKTFLLMLVKYFYWILATKMDRIVASSLLLTDSCHKVISVHKAWIWAIKSTFAPSVMTVKQLDYPRCRYQWHVLRLGEQCVKCRSLH